MFGFLFWFFFIGIVVASLQDLKRREVDNWLGLFLILSSVTYLLFVELEPGRLIHVGFFIGAVILTSFLYFYNADESDEPNSKKKFYFLFITILLFFSVVIFGFVRFFGFGGMPPLIVATTAFLAMFIISNLFYEGRVFAGGDAKLLFAMTALFITSSFLTTLTNIGIFLLFLMFSGSVYGLIYSLVLYFTKFKKVNKKIKERLSTPFVKFSFLLGIVLIIFSFWNNVFLLFAILAFLLPLLFVFAKALEGVFMMKTISGKELREGDWLAHDVKVGKGVVKADWDGLSLKSIRLMKNLKKVDIKEGLPFVPAFLIAYISYVFLKEVFIAFLVGLA
jgi:hypothetical protein